MNSDLKSIVVGIIGALAYDLLKKWFLKYIVPANIPEPISMPYSNAVLKRQFYICFPLGIFTNFFANKLLPTSFLRTFLLVTASFCAVLCLSSFICAMDKISYLQKRVTHEDAK